VTYGGETWTLTSTDENALRIFERKIYGPLLENWEFRICYNEELNELIKGEDIVRFIKAQRLQWLGHIERTNETDMPKRMLQSKIYMTRKIGRPSLRWLGDVYDDLLKMKVKGWGGKMKNGGGLFRRSELILSCSAEGKEGRKEGC
jgi:hypothetical protein